VCNGGIGDMTGKERVCAVAWSLCAHTMVVHGAGIGRGVCIRLMILPC